MCWRRQRASLVVNTIVMCDKGGIPTWSNFLCMNIAGADPGVGKGRGTKQLSCI